ncbi:uncharacterized protein LOC113851433 [Abrus precatorius]|uniref:Uncharacterized protein LOC113851433 n=1 Tax=Abrus precatorius TaxID=3816 RepID=A0A8B8K237_ABRPR|nr:uncharacterized protein LOC113851433 [Abrus precatorius]
MGLLMSYMGGTGFGLATQATSFVTGTLYDRFIERQIKDFDAFHAAILDIFNAINMALPGKHYDAPAHREIEMFYEEWHSESREDTKKEIFSKFMYNNVNLSKADESMMITGLVAPPAAMVAKRAGQSLPQLSVVKSIPDVAFVPTATIFALIAVKLSKRMAFKNLPS